MSTDRQALGARLRAAREADPYWSREQMARLLRAAADPRELESGTIAHVKSLARRIKAWERGDAVPALKYRRLYARVLETTEEELFGELANAPWSSRLEQPAPADHSRLWEGLTPDDEERLARAIARPARVDKAVARSLATILASQRRMDDVVGPAAILPATAVQATTALRLLREARGQVRDALLPVAAEWVQFHGWLHAELLDTPRAMQLLTSAEELADEAGDGTLAAQATNFKGYLARRLGLPRGIVRHFMTAYHTPGAHPAQRLGDAVQAAQGYALLGDRRTARRLLGEAMALSDEAARELPPGTAYWLTPDYHHLNIGLALLSMKEHAAAAENLQHGLQTLPADQQGAQWAEEYRVALAHAQELSS